MTTTCLTSLFCVHAEHTKAPLAALGADAALTHAARSLSAGNCRSACRILELSRRLKEAKIAHRLNQCREDAILIEVNVPGERWEIEFVDYDDEVHVEIERFRSNGKIYDESMLDELFTKYSANSPEPTPEEVRQDHEAFFRE